MRKLTYLAAAAAISSLALAANPASANPLAGGLTDRNLSTVELNDGLVQKVHRWHCRKRFGWFRGHRRWHRHWRACDDDHVGFGVVPFFSFTIFDDDDDHFHKRRFHHRRKFRRHRKRKNMY